MMRVLKTLNFERYFKLPCKRKFVQGNHMPFMNKYLLEEIIRRARLHK